MGCAEYVGHVGRKCGFCDNTAKAKERVAAKAKVVIECIWISPLAIPLSVQQ